MSSWPKRMSATLKSSRFWRVVEFMAVIVGVVIAVVTFYRESEDRQNQRLVAGWQLLTEVSPGASGKKRALQYLHGNGESLVAVNLSFVRHDAPVYLQGTDLYDEKSGKGTDFRLASLAGAILQGADLRNSDFSLGCLYKTEFGGAKLAGSRFIDADLRQANFWTADLTDVVLERADLSGTHMQLSKGLTQGQLDKAYFCEGYGPPDIPEGLKLPPSRTCNLDVLSNAQGCLWSQVDSRRK